MTDPKQSKHVPADPDVMTEEDVLAEGACLDEGDVDQELENELRERARDRHPDR